MVFSRLGGCWCALAVALACAAPVLAQAPGSEQGGSEDPGSNPEYWRRFGPQPEWQEDRTRFPSFPREEDLIPFAVPGSRYEHFIDQHSLSLGKDEVTRYTVVLQAGRARNVLYEAIRCETREHRIIAYGTSRGEFHLRARSRWERIYPSGTSGNDYAWVLWDRYVCSSSGNWLPLKEVVAKLRTG